MTNKLYPDKQPLIVEADTEQAEQKEIDFSRYIFRTGNEKISEKDDGSESKADEEAMASTEEGLPDTLEYLLSDGSYKKII